MKKVFTIMAMSVLISVPCFVFGATVDFGWDANKEQDLAGYRLYQSLTSKQYTKGVFVLEILAPAVTGSLSNVKDGKYFWVLTAFDKQGNESGWSNEVSLTVDETAPSAPTSLWALIKKLLAWLKSGFGVKVSYS